MYARVISVLFYMFFTCVIFNPQIKGLTIYLYVVLPFFDPGFVSFLLATARRWVMPFGIALVACGLSVPSAAIKLVAVGVCIAYVMYTIARRMEYLHFWMAINILFAIVQFITYYVAYDISVQLGPDQISQMLWGTAAAETNTNFYEIMLFARVCGFSREAGFFASLISVSFVLYLLQGKRNRWMLLLYLVGLFISLSKASFVLVIFGMLYLARRPLRSLHPLVSIGVFFGLSMLVALYFAQHNFFGSETFADRFSGYPFLLDANLSDLLKGLKAKALADNYSYLPYIHMSQAQYYVRDATFSSLPGLIVDVGLIAALVLIGVLGFTAADGYVVLLFLLATATLSPLMVTSFVPISYVICYWPRFAEWIAEQRAIAAAPPTPRLIARLRPVRTAVQRRPQPRRPAAML
ncbi:hypothetical protein [Paraburkholderia phosphatilytica]|uniref:hypothetical protein n=1 Tax=Paraburkholderia phosphatilytica TaxID=2282883 RepID=UPI000E4D4057|nr:hypothetical protein [Paraburkholderia phosphatilytica]